MTAPFTISEEALTWIADRLNEAKNAIELKGLVPVIGLRFGYQVGDEQTGYRERFTHPHFDVGWCRDKSIEPGGFTEIDLQSGMRIHVKPDALNELRGNRLVVENVPVGLPEPTSKFRPLLRLERAC